MFVCLLVMGRPLPGGATPRGRHSQGSPLPGCIYKHTMLFCWSVYGRCCSAEIYTRDAVLLEYMIIGDAVPLEYITAMMGVATPNPNV